MGQGEVTVRGFPRIHVSLIDLGHATPRRYGGVGFSLDYCPVEVSYRTSDQFRLIGFDRVDVLGRSDLDRVLRFGMGITEAHEFELELRRMPPQHVGLGSKTALLMSVIKAIDLGQSLKLTNEEVQLRSGRGGTSGIGVHAFFFGGFLCDTGHKDSDDSAYSPSSFGTPVRVPPRIVSLPFPDSWQITLVMAGGDKVHGDEEAEFFATNTPIPGDESLRVLGWVYHGIVPAVAEHCLTSFKTAMSAISRIGFKAREIAAQEEPVQKLFSALDDSPHCAVGMSSLGPLLYAIHLSNDNATLENLVKITESEGGSVIATCRGRNRGFEMLV